MRDVVRRSLCGEVDEALWREGAEAAYAGERTMRGDGYAKEHRSGRRWICKTDRLRNECAGRRRMCKVVRVPGRGVERWKACWLRGDPQRRFKSFWED